MTPARGEHLISDDQLATALRLLSEGHTGVATAKQLHLSLSGLRFALARRTEYRSGNQKRIEGGRRHICVGLDPEVFAMLQEQAARRSMTAAELVEAALEQYLA
jgi:hypothetical protein